jgi:hypothetical protein
MNDDSYDDDDMSDEEIELIVQAAVGDLLNIAAGVAELQVTDEAAEQIYAMCDLVAEYMGVERAEISTVENPDGSYTTRINPSSGAEESVTRATGSIRTAGKPKFRVIDKNTRTDFDDDE